MRGTLLLGGTHTEVVAVICEEIFHPLLGCGANGMAEQKSWGDLKVGGRT